MRALFTLSVSILIPPYCAFALECTSPSLIGWWPGDEDAVDHAGPNDGTLVGGSFQAAASNGVFPLDFARLLTSAAPLEGGGWSRTAGTMFDQLNADCRLIAGQVRCDSFNMQTRRGLLSGSGSVDLAQQTLDWILFVASNSQPLKASQLAMESPPRISLSGPLADPMIRRADRPALGDGSHPAMNQATPR